MQPPQALPGFWIFMYRVSPLTYLVSAIASTGMHDRAIVCATNELSRFVPPENQSCGTYLSSYLASPAGAAGTLLNPSAMAPEECAYCPLRISDQFLASVSIKYDTRWRDFGIGFAYIGFNIAMAIFLYYAIRVKRWDLKYFVKRSGGWLAWSVGEFGRGIRAALVGHGKDLPVDGSKDAEKAKGNRIY